MRILLFLIGLPLLAQTGEISGSISDASRAVIPSAQVTIRNAGTQAERVVFSNGEGLYTATFLQPGDYDVTVGATGFRTETRSSVHVAVGDTMRLDFTLSLGTTGESVSVNASTAPVTSDSAAVGTVINRQFLENLPLNGRSFQTLIALTPGVVMTKANFGEQGQFSVNGQRANANYFTVDGASANIGVSAGLTLVQSGTGALPGFGATGGTNTLVAVEAIEEFKVQTSSYSPEYGRMPGAQISIVTRSGTNKFHGALFDFFRNDVLDASNWFQNAQSLEKPALRQNDFGAALGGPVWIPKLYDGRNKTFFFFSYEGLRLQQPQVAVTDVPSLDARANSVDSMLPFLNSFPLPNRPATRLGFAPFVASYSNASSLDATSLRVDQLIGTRATVFARYNHAPSDVSQRLFALNNPTETISGTDTATFGATFLISPRITDELRANYSLSTGASFSSLDTFGGATPLLASTIVPAGIPTNDAFVGFFLTGGIQSSYYLGKNVSNTQHQYNVTDAASFVARSHQLKVGIDYRHVGTYNGARSYDQFAYFVSPSSAVLGRASSVIVEAQTPGSIRLDNVSTFAQDTWHIGPKTTLTYGLRWEVNPAPTGGPGHPLYTFASFDSPKNLSLAPLGTPFYSTKWGNFAPRVGIARQLGKRTTVRAGFGMFYDLGSGLLGQSAASFPYYRVNSSYDAPYPLAPSAALPPPFKTTGPISSIYGAASGLKLPVTYEWNVAIERAIGSQNTVRATYVGAAGRDLLRMNYYVNPNDSITYAYLITNNGFSNFNSLQLQFERRLTKGLQVLASYGWAHSLDNASTDSASYIAALQVNPLRDYASSDFDIRHTVSAAFSYALPKWKTPIFKDWGLDSVIVARTATPIDITYSRDLGFGAYNFRPDLVAGTPLYLPDPNVAGGQRINPDAFELQNSFPGRQGTLGRNVLRGFPLSQINFTVRREFPMVESMRMQFRAEMFNALNHPNFADPSGDLLSPEFGYSTQMTGQALGRGGVNGGLNPLYQVGGPRSIQLALRVVF